MRTQRPFEAKVLDQRQIALEPGPVGQPNKIAVERLALLLDRHVIPVDGAVLEAQHACDRAYQAGLAAAIAPFQDQQPTTFERKRKALETGSARHGSK